MENSKTNLNVVQRFYDAYNKKQDAILNEVIANDYVDYGHQPPGRGVQGAKRDHQDLTRAFEDARFDIDEMFGSDDRVAVRWTLHATHTGPLRGFHRRKRKQRFAESAFIGSGTARSRRPAIRPISSPCSRSSAQSNKSRRRQPR